MTSPIRLAVLLDPIATLNPFKDSTYAMLKTAYQLGWEIHIFTIKDMFFKNNNYFAYANKFHFKSSIPDWYELEKSTFLDLTSVDILLFRKDPPVNSEYIYATYLLEGISNRGVLVANNPKSVRDFNEKIFATLFPEFSPNTLITSDIKLIKEFLDENAPIIVKPLDGMGGTGIFKLSKDDTNINVILETATQNGTKTVMAQKFIPEIVDGDKRILLINGEPVHYGIKRIPAPHDHRGNLAAKASYEGFRIGKLEHDICELIGPKLKEHGLYFVGLDIIGSYVTEINITCPTCIQEIDTLYDLNIAKTYLQELLRLRKMTPIPRS